MSYIKDKLFTSCKPKPKAMANVNLDALIQREDLENLSESNGDEKLGTGGIPSIGVNQLMADDIFYQSLRKPDFQRETKEWSPKQVYELVKSFLDGDLIPAIILWSGHSGNIFVIDGAHRLSALIAWVTDDYGDRGKSVSFLADSLSDKEKKIAKETRILIEKNVGSYADILWASKNRDTANPERVAIAQRLTKLPIVVQWVPGTTENAEKSFFKINEAGAIIDKTEKRLLMARHKPNAIAARAILRAGRGHTYWSTFDRRVQDEIVDEAAIISNWLFKPQLETPTKTLDTPIAGHPYAASTRELVLNIVHFSNGIKIVDKSTISNKEKYPEENIEKDATGTKTLEFLKKTKQMISNITGTESSSLGLHPSVYFYSVDGKYQVTAFLAFIDLIKDLEQKGKLIEFTRVRGRFEEFFWKHKNIVNQSQVVWGSGVKGYRNLSKMLLFILELLWSEKSDDEILENLDNSDDYNFFKPGVRLVGARFKKKFSDETKSQTFIQSAIKTCLRCPLCKGYLHLGSMQFDHILAIEDGGVGNVENAQPVHPYCNSIKKDYSHIFIIGQK